LSALSTLVVKTSVTFLHPLHLQSLPQESPCFTQGHFLPLSELLGDRQDEIFFPFLFFPHEQPFLSSLKLLETSVDLKIR
jgi:hypothetical protein